MFKRKPLHRLVEEADGGAHGLRRALGAMNLVSLGVGVIVGAGIFVVTGTAAAQYAGPGIVLSFILSAIACAFAGLCYAEFASMIPIAGSAYTYAYATLGEIVAWIIGWDLILEYLFGASAVAVLRYRHPEAPRAFRCPWVPLVPILGALLSAPANGQPARRHVAPATRLDGRRAGALLRLRPQAQPAAAPRRAGGARGVGERRTRAQQAGRLNGLSPKTPSGASLCGRASAAGGRGFRGRGPRSSGSSPRASRSGCGDRGRTRCPPARTSGCILYSSRARRLG